MARDFGAVESDLIQFNYAELVNLAPKMTFACWYQQDSDGPNGAGRIYNQQFGSQILALTSVLRLNVDFSTTNGEWDIARPSLSDWHHLMMSYDGSSVSNDPEWWIDGSSQIVTRVTAPVGTITTPGGLMRVGNRLGTANRAWDGRLAEMAFWTRVLSEGELRGVWAAGPLAVPDYMFYTPLYGLGSPEPNYFGGAENGVTTGTLVAPHAPVFPRFGVETGWSLGSKASDYIFSMPGFSLRPRVF